MALIIANGLMIKEGYYLYSDLVTQNPIIPDGFAIYSYDSIGANGQFVGVKGYLGSDVEFNFLEPIYSNNIATPRLVKDATMTVDYSYTYTVDAGDVGTLGNYFSVVSVLVNGSPFFASISYSAFPFAAGDTITLYGLDTMANISSLKFILQ